MSDFKAKTHQNRFWLGLRPRTPLGELTALPQISDPWLDLRGPSSKEKEGKRGKGKGREGKGMEGGRKE